MWPKEAEQEKQEWEVRLDRWEGELVHLFLPCHSHYHQANVSPIIFSLNYFNDFLIILPVSTLWHLPFTVHIQGN